MNTASRLLRSVGTPGSHKDLSFLVPVLSAAPIYAGELSSLKAGLDLKLKLA